MTQPLYDLEQLEQFMDRVGPLPIPLILGVMPLQSHKHAEFLHNELPGVSIPAPIRERMRQAGERGQAEGVLQAQEFLSAAQRHVQGVYFMPSFWPLRDGRRVSQSLEQAGLGWLGPFATEKQRHRDPLSSHW